MSDTHDQIVDSAMKHLYKMGYNRFSFAYVAEDCGIAKASIHYHFPNKDALVLAAIDKYSARVTEALDRLRNDSTLSANEKFEALFKFAFDHIVDTQYKGCLAGNLGLEISETNKAIAARVRAFLQRKTLVIAAIVEQGRAARSYATDFEASEFAQSIVLMIEGGIMLAKIYKSDEPLLNALDLCRERVQAIQRQPRTLRDLYRPARRPAQRAAQRN